MNNEAKTVQLKPDEATSVSKAKEWSQKASADLGEVYLHWVQAKSDFDRLDAELEKARDAALKSRQQYYRIMQAVAKNHSIEEGEWQLEGESLVRKDS